MHISVLMNEVIDLLVVKPDGLYVDGTLGNGGHTKAIVEKGGAGVRVVGVDRDVQALERAAGNLASCKAQVTLVHGNSADMSGIVKEKGIRAVDGVLLDLGVSSEQLDEGERGFSFMKDGPLDMRMDGSGDGASAADLVNGLSVEELCRIIREFGEERMAWQIARAIVRERAREPIRTTGRLAAIVEKAAGGRRGRIHPATKTFQALRMSVNDELGSLERALDGGLSLLAPGGRMAVISFHSLEDRMVKSFFGRHAGKWESLQAGGQRWIGELPVMKIVTRKPVMASGLEAAENPRSRSAKLRVAERCEMDRV